MDETQDNLHELNKLLGVDDLKLMKNPADPESSDYSKNFKLAETPYSAASPYYNCDGNESDLCFHVFLSKFKKIPNVTSLGKLHLDKTLEALKDFELEYKSEDLFAVSRGEEIVSCLILQEDKAVFVTVYNRSKDSAIINTLKPFLKKDRRKKPTNIFVMVEQHGQLSLQELKFKCPPIKNPEVFYGKGFNETNNLIKKKLRTENGLFIFHGEPGTGKTTYIKHLAHKINRKFVFVPNSMIDSLINPSLISMLLSHQNLVLILEDAEKVVTSREKEDNFFAATLLNLTDGIIGTACDIAILVTFNTGLAELDKALLRKGRLRYKHHFDNLDIEESQILIDHLKKNHQATGPMSLADIFLLEDEVGDTENKQEKRILGFGA